MIRLFATLVLALVLVCNADAQTVSRLNGLYEGTKIEYPDGSVRIISRGGQDDWSHWDRYYERQQRWRGFRNLYAPVYGYPLIPAPYLYNRDYPTRAYPY